MKSGRALWLRERIVNPGVPGLQETLLYHFVPSRLQSGQLETHLAQTLRTFEGKDVYVESQGGVVGSIHSHRPPTFKAASLSLVRVSTSH